MRSSRRADPDPEHIERLVLTHVADLGVEHAEIWIDPAYANTAAFCERYGHAPDESVNCILVASRPRGRERSNEARGRERSDQAGEPRYAACLVQATRQLDVNRVVRRLLGVRKASFASAEDTIAVTGMLPDGVTPFGLPAHIPLYIDAGVMALERVIVGGGSRALKLSVPADALAKLANAQVVDGLAKPSPPVDASG